jgi:hypothetical protein
MENAMKSWKQRLRGRNMEQQKQTEALELIKKRDELFKDAGEQQFVKAISEHKIMVINAEISGINEKLNALAKPAPEPPKEPEAPKNSEPSKEDVTPSASP